MNIFKDNVFRVVKVDSTSFVSYIANKIEIFEL